MTYVRCGFISVLFAVLMLFGCGLTADQQKRVNDLVEQNEALRRKQTDLLEKMKAGTATPAEVAEAFSEITAQMKKNADEIKAIKDEGGTWAMIGAIAGTFGRTALHAVAAAVPGGGTAGVLLQGFLTLLLGGSSTKSKEGQPAPTA